MEEVLEEMDSEKKPEFPQALKTLAVLSYIGNGICLATFLVFFVLTLVNAGSLWGTRGLGNAAPVLSLIMLLLVGLCALCIVGVYKMSKGKKVGFWLYLVPNILWVLGNINVIYKGASNGSNHFFLLLTLGFIGGYVSHYKSLR